MFKIPYIKSLIATLLVSISIISCYPELALPVKASFQYQFIDADASVPVTVAIENTSTGGDQFEWFFEGATPEYSTDENPGQIRYEAPGTYTLKQIVSNVDGSIDTIEKSITLADEININFEATIVDSSYSPVSVALNNMTQGEGLTYAWSFEGGTPETSTAQQPENIIFETSGTHNIHLSVSNGFETLTETKSIEVAPQLTSAFSWEVNFEDDDLQVPLQINTSNNSISATDYLWTITGPESLTSTEIEPIFTLTTEGTYTLSLTASNGKQNLIHSETIEVYANTGLRNLEDIRFGINKAHNTNVEAAFFSTSLRQNFTANQITTDNGAAIDIAFLGLNNSFTFNQFVSPDQVQTHGFTAIPNATTTQFINSQELCECPASLSATDFDAMTNDDLLDALDISTTPTGVLAFDRELLPRIVLFENASGKKGAIKIKAFVEDGDQAYLLCDLKYQK